MSYIIISVMVLSIILGYFLRKVSFVRRLSGLSGYVVFVLLFLMGVSVGADSNIVGAFVSVGSKAVAMALAGSIGAMLAAWGVYTVFFKKEDSDEG